MLPRHPLLVEAILALCLVVAMWLCAWIVDYVRRDFRLVFRLAQTGLGSTLTYLFITKPY